MKKVLSLPPQSHINLMFRPQLWQRMQAEFDLWQNPGERHLKPEDVLNQLPTCDAILTGWGARVFTPQVLEAAPNLRIVAHTAGSPRLLFEDATVEQVLVPRGISVYSGASGMAHNVAEAAIGMMILSARRWPLHEAAYRHSQLEGQEGHNASSLDDAPTPRNATFLMGATVGLVSASKVARALIPLLQAFRCRILSYDPFLSPEAARSLGVELSSLEDVFSQCDIVSLHTPDLPETRGLIGRELLSRMREGATFINTARGAVLDHEALAQECRSGRISAALDVSEPEPLPPDSPLWEMPNVLLLPHIAGVGRFGLDLIGQGAFQALKSAFANQPFEGQVPLDVWQTIA